MIRWTILEASYTPTLGVISCSLHLDCVEKVSKLSSQQQPYYYYRACSWELVDLKSNHDIWRPVRTLQWLSRCGDRTLDEALCRRRLTHNVMGWHPFWVIIITASLVQTADRSRAGAWEWCSSPLVRLLNLFAVYVKESLSPSTKITVLWVVEFVS